MLRSLWTAASGMIAQQYHIDTVANNLSNVNTFGFKRNRIDFEDLIYQHQVPQSLGDGYVLPSLPPRLPRIVGS